MSHEAGHPSIPPSLAPAGEPPRSSGSGISQPPRPSRGPRTNRMALGGFEDAAGRVYAAGGRRNGIGPHGQGYEYFDDMAAQLALSAFIAFLDQEVPK